MRASFGAAAVIVVGVLSPAASPAQTAPALASARCDSVVQAARVDSVPAALFISARRIDAGEDDEHRTTMLANYIGAAFVPPRPFRLAVFAGPPLTRILRPLAGDSAAVLRSPTVTGVYRFTAHADAPVTHIRTMRASLMPGFDSAAMAAVHTVGSMRDLIGSADEEDSATFELRVSTDSSAGAGRLLSAYFPRMPVIDAAARGGNPAAIFPEAAKRDSIRNGDVVLRFVVDRDGTPVPETVEVVRANVQSFLQSALDALPTQAFSPATIGGCAVAQLVEYPFTFVSPEPNLAPLRH